MIPERLAAVTVDDLLRAGACRDGVIARRDELAPNATAAPVDRLLAVLDSDERAYLTEAAGLSGDGSGSGYGSG